MELIKIPGAQAQLGHLTDRSSASGSEAVLQKKRFPSWSLGTRLTVGTEVGRLCIDGENNWRT
ncbi:MAG: hypothetical protein D3922_09990 [Candidatus Electrothrix sp. AR1]|nr:hypothetical protein [Candidatus Electrothrix sp. AR1]